jgi:glycosyltransferase involved in cell wall biosynthesis
MLPGVEVHDLRVPVRVLNLAWHRLGWPPVDTLTRSRPDVVHAAHPLIIPSRRAARVVTIHDLDFLDHPERTRAEIRRDYPALVRRHAAQADGIVTNSFDTRARVVERLGADPAKIAVARPGPPAWASGPRQQPRDERGPILFVGTLERRKNIDTLLTAYEQLVAARPDVPALCLAGHTTPEAAPWIERSRRGTLAGRVSVPGYVPHADRRALFERASIVVIPSWFEGFGLTALEAMAVGVPVVASRRGALPEVIGDAGVLVEPDRPDEIAAALLRLLDDGAWARTLVERASCRVREFSWDRAAAEVRALYRAAVERRQASHAHRD